MIDKNKIKVVKRSEGGDRPKAAGRKKTSPRAAAREMVSTVSEWVADIKQRNTDDARAAFELLFAPKRPLNGS